ASGPIHYAFMAADASSGPDASVTYGDHSFVLKVGLRDVANTVPGDPPIVIRIAGGVSGSLNQALDCDGTQLSTEIQNGCQTPYQVNPTFTCPDPSSTPYLDCVPVSTGDKVGQVSAGMKARVGSGATPRCPVNNWVANYPNFGSDPRVFPLILTSPGAFNGSGG